MDDNLKREQLIDLIKQVDIELLDKSIYESNCVDELILILGYYLYRSEEKIMEVKLTKQELKRIKKMFPEQKIEAIKVVNEGDRKHVSIFLKGFVSELHTYIPIK